MVQIVGPLFPYSCHEFQSATLNLFKQTEREQKRKWSTAVGVAVEAKKNGIVVDGDNVDDKFQWARILFFFCSQLSLAACPMPCLFSFFDTNIILFSFICLITSLFSYLATADRLLLRNIYNIRHTIHLTRGFARAQQYFRSGFGCCDLLCAEWVVVVVKIEFIATEITPNVGIIVACLKYSHKYTKIPLAHAFGTHRVARCHRPYNGSELVCSCAHIYVCVGLTVCRLVCHKTTYKNVNDSKQTELVHIFGVHIL